MDKTGEFVQEKNCYANPHEPFYCIFTALGCYLSLNAEALAKTEKLFINPGSQFKTAAQTYARDIHKWEFAMPTRSGTTCASPILTSMV